MPSIVPTPTRPLRPSNPLRAAARLAGLAVAGFVVTLAVSATPVADAPPPDGDDPVPHDACADGVVKDDGVPELSYGWVPSAVDGIFVQVFEANELPRPAVEQVCICWRRAGDDTTIDFEVVFFRDADGQPEDEPYASIPATLDNVTEDRMGMFAEVPTPGVEVPRAERFYVGARWNPSVDQRFFLCDDQSETTEPVNIWFRDDRAEDWDNAFETADPFFEQHRALLIRVVPAGGSLVDVPTLGVAAGALFALVLLAAGLLAVRRRL